ncbi:MAG: efflux RND transporter periplasmic adaptor subunit [Phycisphaerales bacterium]|nr:efflux RND transporter periplasmic adaptor subunit [Phycisphaerales bacterium]
MNQQIPMPARKWMLRIGFPMLVILAAVAILVLASWSALRPASTVRAVAVVIRQVETNEPLQRESEPEVVQAPGWVEADPFSVYAGALTEGIVQDVLVLEGEEIKQGQPVAQLVDDEAKLELKKTDAFVEHLRADLALAEANLAQLPARVKEALANQHALEDEVRRKQKLVESGAVAAGPVQRLAKKLEAAVADVEQLQLEEAILQAMVMDAKALLAEGQAVRDTVQLRLDRMIVRSPIDGIVMERLTSPGSVVNFGNGEHGAHIVHLYDPENLQVRADIPLAQAARVGVGHPAEIVVDVLPGKIFQGKITRFVHRADLQKNTVEAKIHIDDPSRLMKPDMLARVRILQPAVESGETRRISRVFVPRDGIKDGDKVMVIENMEGDRGVVRERSVKTGPGEVDGWIEIISGLAAGDRIVLDDVTDGQNVKMEVE